MSEEEFAYTLWKILPPETREALRSVYQSTYAKGYEAGFNDGEKK